MDYAGIVKSSKQKVGNYAIATKILDLMDKLRLDENNESKRRWIWELLQNAKDVRYDDADIQVEINFVSKVEEQFIEFRHNGKPFTVDNLTFLIEQVSTKERNPDKDTKVKTTGKFGTGFLTTHLLSELVIVDGFIKEPELAFKPFKILLDRSGVSLQDIMQSVNKSLEILDTIEQIEPAYDFNKQKFNTGFRYQLNDDGLEVARVGLEDLEKGLAYTLIFIPEIANVSLKNKGGNYQRAATKLKNDVVRVESIVLNFPQHTSESLIAILTAENVTIAVPVKFGENGEIAILPLPESQPRLYCDFPLIGSETFPIPFVINSSFFNPNEPRNGIFLTDKNDPRIIENKTLVLEAIQLFKKFTDFASANCTDLFNLIPVGHPPSVGWLSKTWYVGNVSDVLYEALSWAKLVDTCDGNRKSILDENQKIQVYFPVSPDANIRDMLWDLGRDWFPSMLPKKEIIHDWFPVIWKDCGKMSLSVVAKWISTCGNLSELQRRLIIGTDVIDWLNRFYKIVNLEGKFIDEIVTNRIAIIPNQDGQFKTQERIYIDQNIDEELKDVLFFLGENIKGDLRDKLLFTENTFDEDAQTRIRHNSRDGEFVVGRINRILTNNESKNRLDASLRMIALSQHESSDSIRNKIYDFCTLLFSGQVLQKKLINYNGINLWVEADKIIVAAAVRIISECVNVERFISKFGFESKKVAIAWLGEFIEFLSNTTGDQHLNVSTIPILPNQKGDFVIKDRIFLDNGDIDEQLKDICELLGEPIRDDLLDKAIFLIIPEQRTRTAKGVAEKITTLVYSRFSEVARSANTKEIFRLILKWFQRDKDRAEDLFSELYFGRHKLYDDDEVVANMERAEDLNQLMNEFNINSVDQLREKILAANAQKNNGSEPEIVTAEILASLGISSKEEFDEAMKDINLALKFSHVSTPSSDMYLYAKKLIDRSKRNILDFLKTAPAYDCSDAEEIAPTIYGGIKHNKIMINVVCRPCDHGKVIFYYSSEKDTLELSESQLWIDNGIIIPRQLTLGKILKDTEINRIPVKL